MTICLRLFGRWRVPRPFSLVLVCCLLFSWAFWLAQQVHFNIALTALPDVGRAGLIVARSPPPRIESSAETVLLVYADNANRFELDPDLVNARRVKLSIAINERGSDTHGIVDSTTLVESLAIQRCGDPPTLSATHARR